MTDPEYGDRCEHGRHATDCSLCTAGDDLRARLPRTSVCSGECSGCDGCIQAPISVEELRWLLDERDLVRHAFKSARRDMSGDVR